MKQDAKNKLIFVAGSVFGLVVLGALVQVVGAQYQWVPPSETFPNANTAPPIDISATGQKKIGNISVEVGTGRPAVTVSDNTYVGTTNSRIIFGAGTGQNTMIMYGEGVTLPHGTAALSNTDEGMIRYNVGGKKVQFNDGTGWKDVGTGTGSGDSYWTTTNGGIAYTGGDVFISNGGWTLKSSDVKNLSGSRLPCDVNHQIYDCDSSNLPKIGTNGQIGYDEAQEPHPTKPIPISYFNIYEYDINKNTSSLLAGKISAEKIYTGDIFISNKAWHEETSFEYGTDGSYRTKRGTAMCPVGYYVIGIEAWDADDGRYCDTCLTGFKIKCARL